MQLKLTTLVSNKCLIKDERRDTMKTVHKWLENLIVITIVICAVLCAVSIIRSRGNPNTLPSIGPYKFMAVLSGSMSPTFNVYDLIMDKKVSPNNLKKGDVITFWGDNNTLITHRIVDIQIQNGKTAYKTRGDANNVEDERLTDASKVEGTYIFKIPYGGLVVTRLKGPLGIVIVWLLFVYMLFINYCEKKVELMSKKG